MNWQHESDMEMQIRTRGAIRTRGSAAVTQTRASIRTRGAVAVETKPLAQLVAELRAKAQGSPSAVVIHGCDDAPAQMFLSQLMPLLDEADAVWLVPAGTAPATEPPPAWPGAVVLDGSREVDARTYANLVVDIVFFPTGNPAEVCQWYDRTEAVVVGTTAGHETTLRDSAPHNAPTLYCWSAAQPEVLVSL